MSILNWRKRMTGSPEGHNSLDVTLLDSFAKIAGQDANIMLQNLCEALEPNASEETKYRVAEAISGQIYPKFKFSEFGRIFLEDQEFIDYYKKIMDPNNWHSLDRKYTLSQLLNLTKNLSGDYVECGAYKGASSYLMCQVGLQSAKHVHLFDSFEGLSEPQQMDGEYWSKHALSVTEDELHKTLAGFNNYTVYKGWIPNRFIDYPQKDVSFLHVDVDLYQPTLDTLNFFYEKIVPGGIILMDDYGFNTCPGAKQAADDFFSKVFEPIVKLPTGQALVIKKPSQLSVANARENAEVSPKPERLVWTNELVSKFWNGCSKTTLTQLSFGRQGGKGLSIAIDHLFHILENPSLPRNSDNIISKNVEVLDYGAGDGDLLRVLCERGVKSSAFEISSGRRNLLEQRLLGTSNFLGVIDDKSNKKFDVIIMAEVIEHILDQDMDKTLRLIHNMLAPGGIVVITTPNNEVLENSDCYCANCNTLFHRWQHVRSFTNDSLRLLLSQYNFDEIVTHNIEFSDNLYLPYDHYYGDPEMHSPPSYLTDMWENKKTRFGSESNIVYLGRRI